RSRRAVAGRSAGHAQTRRRGMADGTDQREDGRRRRSCVPHADARHARRGRAEDDMSADALLVSVLRARGIALLERLPNGTYHPFAPLPSWVEAVFDE